MQITILSVTKNPATTAKGGAYEKLDLAFKNLTFQGKVEGKNLTPFGTGKAAYDVLANAQAGQTFDITVVKENGFNNWTQAVQSTPGAAQASVAQQTTSYAKTPPAAANSRGFETPEERSAKQVYIIRQSSLSAATAALAVGAKSPPDAESVIERARKYEAYVFEQPNSVKGLDTSGFDTMESDVPL